VIKSNAQDSVVDEVELKDSFGTGVDNTKAWKLMAGIGLTAFVLLLMVGHETQKGPEEGGWWNEPALGPVVSLLIAAGFALPEAFIARTRSKSLITISDAGNEWLRAFILSGVFLATLWSINYIGYGLATLLLAGFTAMMAGFRGRKLIAIAVLTSLTLILFFRVILGIWFPMAAIFKLLPVLEPLGRYL